MNHATPKRVAVILTDRANFGRLWPVMKAIQNRPELEMKTIVTGSMTLERFGRADKVVEEYGFTIDARVFMELEGSSPVTMAKSIGIGIMEMSSAFEQIKPDLVLLIGDRYEALATATAAVYLNIPVAHIQGGEVSGSIDESARHAITKLSHYHFPSTERAAGYIARMGEDPAQIFNFGCPCGDYILNLGDTLPADLFDELGVGAPVSAVDPFLLVIFHPVTTAYGDEGEQVCSVLTALHRIKHPTVWLWPNIDAGANRISHELRLYREHNDDSWLRLVKNFEPNIFQQVLKNTACAIGNSSSFIRDSSFTGTPVVMVGDRQKGRERAENVMDVPPVTGAVEEAITAQLAHGRYAPSTLYGDGAAAERIAAKLCELKPYVQKRLHYIYD